MRSITMGKWLRIVAVVVLFIVSAQAALFASCSPKGGLSESVIEENTREKYCAFHTLESFISTANMHLSSEEQWNLAVPRRAKLTENAMNTPDSQSRYLNIKYLIDDAPLKVVLSATIRPYVKAVLSVDADAFTNSMAQLKKRMEDEDRENFCDENLNPLALLNVEMGDKEYVFLPHVFLRNLDLISSYDRAYYGFWIWGLSQKLAEFTLDIIADETLRK